MDILNRRLDVRQHIKVVTKADVTSPKNRDLTATPLHETDPVSGRDFKFEVDHKDVDITWDNLYIERNTLASLALCAVALGQEVHISSFTLIHMLLVETRDCAVEPHASGVPSLTGRSQ